MGTVHQYRRLRWGEPRKLSTPDFLREKRPRLAALFRYFGFVALAMLMVIAAAVFLSTPWREAGTTRLVQAVSAPRSMGNMRVTVVDGDSLRAGNVRIRLIGIDAPELFQTCRDDYGRAWSCGRAAKAKLAALVAGGAVACTDRGRDRYDRTLAICSAGNIADLGEALVRAGLAVDYFNGGYDAAEREARAARRGLWRGTFMRPQDWRRRHPRH
jgi:endonuclease YncB( thermonuclease family)